MNLFTKSRMHAIERLAGDDLITYCKNLFGPDAGAVRVGNGGADAA
jgi:hypothetical protein